MKKLFVLCVALAFTAACSKGPDQKTAGPYVFKINDAQFGKEDVQAEMGAIPPEVAREKYKGQEGAAVFVDQIVTKELLFMEGKKQGIDKDKDVIKKIEEFKKLAVIKKLFEKEFEKEPTATDAEIKEFYEKNKEFFMEVNQIRLSHIVVKNEEDLGKVQQRLKAGDDFGTVAAELSADKPSAKAKGDLGYFKKGELSPELEGVAFRMKKGELSRPIKLGDGLHILKVTDVKGKALEFDKVKGFLSQQVAAEKQKERFEKYVENLKKNYKVDINKDELAKLSFQEKEQKKEEPAPAPKEKK